MLTREQFLEVHEYQLFFYITYVMFDLLMYQLLRDVQVTPWWSRTKADAWAMEVDKWFTEEYQQVHDAAREGRLMMEGPSHHQGQRSLPEYKEL
jgi:L-rhamnose mutarotase